MISAALGGRAAEDIVFGDVSTGASNDIEKVTEIARRMVTVWGMSSSRLDGSEPVPISTMIAWAGDNKIRSIEVYGDDLLFLDKEGRQYHSRKEPDSTLIEILTAADVHTGPGGVDVQVRSAQGLSGLGPLTLGKREEMVFLGRDFGEQRNYGDRIADQIDEEVSRIVSEAYTTALHILTEHRPTLDRLAQYLIAEETIEGDDLQRILAGPETEPEPAAAV
jgi:hypothetical protein